MAFAVACVPSFITVRITDWLSLLLCFQFFAVLRLKTVILNAEQFWYQLPVNFDLERSVHVDLEGQHSRPMLEHTQDHHRQ